MNAVDGCDIKSVESFCRVTNVDYSPYMEFAKNITQDELAEFKSIKNENYLFKKIRKKKPVSPNKD